MFLSTIYSIAYFSIIVCFYRQVLITNNSSIFNAFRVIINCLLVYKLKAAFMEMYKLLKNNS